MSYHCLSTPCEFSHSSAQKYAFVDQKMSRFSANLFFFEIKPNMFTQICGMAGNKAKCGISRTIAGRFTPMLSRDLSGANHMLCCCRWMPCICSRRARQRTGRRNYSRRRYGSGAMERRGWQNNNCQTNFTRVQQI